MDDAAATAAMADALIAQGIMTREQIDAGIAAEQAGQSAPDPAAPAAGNPPTPQAPQAGMADPNGAAVPDPLAGFEIDPMFAPPTNPTDYRIQCQMNQELDLPDLKAVQAAFHTAKMPAGIAQSIYSEIERMNVGAKFEYMPDAQLEILNNRTMSQLHQAWGDRTDEMLGHARRFVQDVAKVHPRILNVLEHTGAGSNYAIVRQIAEHAARIYSNPKK